MCKMSYPTNIHIILITSDSFTIEWDPVSGAISYDLTIIINGQSILVPENIPTFYTQQNVPFGASVTISIITNFSKGDPSEPSPPLTTVFLPRSYPTPPIPPQQSPICVDRYPIPNSSKKPIYTFNRREFWSWGANKTGRNCVQIDTITQQ